MGEIDLKPFCGRDPMREYLHKPFAFEGNTYATNGHILIRVTGVKDAATSTVKGKWDGPLAGFANTTFRKFPAITDAPSMEPCDCYLCDGRGFEHDCPECDCICVVCHGEGLAPPKVSGLIDGVSFDLKYLVLIAALPRVEIGFATEGKPLHFRFDGGVGAVMPLKGTWPDHIVIDVPSPESA